MRGVPTLRRPGSKAANCAAMDDQGTRVSKPKKRKAGRTSPPLTRAMLLPMSAALVQKVSLQNHMALVALRQGQGNSNLAGELLKTVFVAFYLAQPDQLTTHAKHFAQAQTAIKALIKDAVLETGWRLEEEHCKGIEAILVLHDAQLAALPTHRIEGAKQRLMRVLEAGSFPSITAVKP